MNHNIVLMTKSKKYNGYCVTGVDVKTGEWLRLMQPGEHAVMPELFKYPNGEEPKLLDRIKVEVIDQCATDLQPENVLFKTESICPDNGSVAEIIANRVEQDYSAHDYVYHNQHPKLLKKALPTDAIEKPYSLMIIEPESMIVRIDSYGKVMADFTWKGIRYIDFRVTDMEFIDRLFPDPETKKIKYDVPSYIVISLGEPFVNPNSGYTEYYKLISSVLDKMDTPCKNRPDNTDSGSNQDYKYQRARDLIETIALGYDPYTGSPLREDSILDKQETIRSFFLAVKALDQLIDSDKQGAEKRKGRKKAFDITIEQVGKIDYSTEPIAISKFVERINAAVDPKEVKKLSYKTVLKWLIKNNYIVEKEIDEKLVKAPTNKGETAGISMEQRTSKYGKTYNVTLYDINAQRMIVDNIDAIIKML